MGVVSCFVKNITNGGALCAISWQISGLPASFHYAATSICKHKYTLPRRSFSGDGSLTIALICRRPCITPCPGVASCEDGCIHRLQSNRFII